SRFVAAVNLTPRSTRRLTDSLPQERVAEHRRLLEDRPPGMSLAAPFYTDPAFFAADMDGIFGRHWVFAGSVAEVREPGDYITVDYGPHSIIVLRNDDGGINALHNVCRHRGARVLPEKSGTTGNIVCPYHSWTYTPEGALIHASAPGELDFD